jgi:hypothetical protein
MQDPKNKKAIMADAYSDKRVKELEKATATPYQMEMASKAKKPATKMLKVMKVVKKPAGKMEAKETMLKAKYSM